MFVEIRKKNLLEFLKVYFIEHQFAPTLKEIAINQGYSSESARRILKALTKDSLVEITRYKIRGISLKNEQ